MKLYPAGRFAFLIRRFGLVLLALLALIVSTIFLVAPISQRIKQSTPEEHISSFSHVLIIAMENHGYDQIIGNPQAAYINSLARTYDIATNYSALSHSDLPNYIQLVAGSNLGITANCTTCFVSGNNLASELESAGKTWKAYMEGMPSNCYLKNTGDYLLYHNPFAYFTNLHSSCKQNDVPYSQFHADLSSGHIPNFVWITPNAIDDMENGTIQQGDAWLSREVPAILHSSAFLNNGILFITWDEAQQGSSSNRVATLVISPRAKTTAQSTSNYNHYSLLRTIEDILGVPPLGASALASPMTDFFSTALDSNILSITVGAQFSQASPQPSASSTSTPHGDMPYVQGAQIIDAAGHPLILRGAQIASPLNFISGWQARQDVTQFLSPTVFNAMRSWHMNALRLPISLWIYNTDPAGYLSILDQTVQEANADGLYVILDNHDDAKSGSPYGLNCAVPKAEDVAFWHAIAGHYASNPMVMFDLFNEPQGLTAQNWLHGGGTAACSSKPATIVGFQPMVDAIRSAGARQIVIAPANIPAVDPSVRIQDPNVMYTIHIYSQIGTGNASAWDLDWGSLLGKYPLYYGEWSVNPNSLVPQQCQPYTPANADSATNAFLQYMQSRNINWTAWEFRAYYLIQDYTTFTPTTFQGSWTTCDVNGHEGMGADVKNYLASAP